LHSVLSSINNTSCKKKAIILWNLTVDFQSDSDSFNPTLWEEQRQQRMTVAFEFEEKKEDDENAGKVKDHSCQAPWERGQRGITLQPARLSGDCCTP